jgi:stearoyl-CoA desaturase (delta-9 desaturase)
MHNDAAALLPYVSDLRQDKFHVWISRWHWVPITALGAVLLVIGGWPYLLWGIFFRTVVGLHSTWLVNSATHMWGSRRFTTADTSRNSLWVALLTFGEGWHNNHHAHPQSSRHGLAWFEVDPNWYGISALRMLGLAWDVKTWRLSRTGWAVEGAASKGLAADQSYEATLRIEKLMTSPNPSATAEPFHLRQDRRPVIRKQGWS